MFKYIKNQSTVIAESTQAIEAKIDYIAMMADIEIETDEQEETDDEQ